MSEGSPARIDRAALERIIQRAAELQTAEREMGDSLTSDELMALGREVGSPGRYLQQALLGGRTPGGHGGVGITCPAALVALGALLPLALLPLPVAFAIGYGVLRRFGPAIARIQL